MCCALAFAVRDDEAGENLLAPPPFKLRGAVFAETVPSEKRSRVQAGTWKRPVLGPPVDRPLRPSQQLVRHTRRFLRQQEDRQSSSAKPSEASYQRGCPSAALGRQTGLGPVIHRAETYRGRRLRAGSRGRRPFAAPSRSAAAHGGRKGAGQRSRAGAGERRVRHVK